MPSFSNFVLGLIGTLVGCWITYKAFYINHHVFFLAWAENKWGPGYGTIAYRWIGLAVAIFSILVMLGRIDLFASPYDTSNSGGRRVQVQVIPSAGSDTKIAP
jgi:hypothetical protein